MAKSPSRTLKLTYLGDASNLSKSTKKAGDDVKSLGDRVKNVGKALAVGFAAIGAAGIAMGKKLFNAFEEVSKANNRIEAVVTSMGNFEGQIGEVTERLVKQAEATAKLTGVDRTLIKESQALLLTFDSVNKTANEAGGIFDRATQASVDLSAAGFGSVTGAATQLAKALEDPVKGLASLGRSGVTFTDEQKELIAALVEANKTFEAQDLILQAIEKQVGGVAEATASGSAKIAQSFGILRDRIALELGPAFEFLVAKALEFVDKFADYWDRNGDDIIQSFRDFADRVKDLFDRFTEFASLVRDELGARGVFDRLREKAGEIGVAFDGMREAFTTFRNTVSGPETEDSARTFARIIDLQYIKPIEKFGDAIEGLLKLLDVFFKAADLFERVRQSFTSDAGRERLGSLAPGGTGFTPATLAPRPTTVVNVTGAIDPEGTARVIRRTLDAQALRTGQVPTPGIAQFQ
jgi:F0F1-type ATP synthase membrane subunit c/vacuolar-type H+-ATPase subunit K